MHIYYLPLYHHSQLTSEMVCHSFNVLMLRNVKHSVPLQLTIKKYVPMSFYSAHSSRIFWPLRHEELYKVCWKGTLHKDYSFRQSVSYYLGEKYSWLENKSPTIRPDVSQNVCEFWNCQFFIPTLLMAVVICLTLKSRYSAMSALNFDTKFREIGKSGRTIIQISYTNVIVLCVQYYEYMTHTSELWVQMGNISSVKDGWRFSPIHRLLRIMYPCVD